MARALSREIPPPRRSTPERTARLLRAHFARHNRRVLLLASVTLLAAVALWTLLYGVACWLLLLALAVIDRPHAGLPAGLSVLFAVTALCALGYAWLDRQLTPDERPQDAKPTSEIVADFLLAIPRLTLAVPATLRAWQRLSRADSEQAAVLLHRLAEVHRLPLYSLSLEIPEPAMRSRILFALQLTEVVDLLRRDDAWWLALHPKRPRAILPSAAVETV